MTSASITVNRVITCYNLY